MSFHKWKNLLCIAMLVNLKRIFLDEQMFIDSDLCGQILQSDVVFGVNYLSLPDGLEFFEASRKLFILPHNILTKFNLFDTPSLLALKPFSKLNSSASLFYRFFVHIDEQGPRYRIQINHSNVVT